MNFRFSDPLVSRGLNYTYFNKTVDSRLFHLQIAYKIAREQLPGRLRETFLVLSDDEPRPVGRLEASGVSLETVRRDRGQKHRRGSESMSVDTAVNAKKPDKTRSSEKRK